MYLKNRMFFFAKAIEMSRSAEHRGRGPSKPVLGSAVALAIMSGATGWLAEARADTGESIQQHRIEINSEANAVANPIPLPDFSLRIKIAGGKADTNGMQDKVRASEATAPSESETSQTTAKVKASEALVPDESETSQATAKVKASETTTPSESETSQAAAKVKSSEAPNSSESETSQAAATVEASETTTPSESETSQAAATVEASETPNSNESETSQATAKVEASEAPTPDESETSQATAKVKASETPNSSESETSQTTAKVEASEAPTPSESETSQAAATVEASENPTPSESKTSQATATANVPQPPILRKIITVQKTATPDSNDPESRSIVKRETVAATDLPLIISRIRIGRNEDIVRLIFESSTKPRFKTSVLINPNRVEIELPETVFFLSSDQNTPENTYITSIQYGNIAPNQSQLAFFTATPVSLVRTFVLEPEGNNRLHRAVIDVRIDRSSAKIKPVKSLSAHKVLASDEAQSPTDNTELANQIVQDKPSALALSSKPVVVVDAGHGGKDSGAQSAEGLLEKDVTLAFALQFARDLVNTNLFQVYVTRDDDTYVSLQDRIQMARRVGASMFISIHADAASSASVSGSTVYTLSEHASDEVAKRIAENENNADLLAGHGINETPDALGEDILLDLAQRDAVNRSVVLAQHVIRSISSTTPLNRRPHRHAGFRVLKTFDIPAILVELGYMTNEDDRNNFLSRIWHKSVSRSMLQAVVEFHEQPNQPHKLGAGFAELDSTNLVLGLMNGKASDPNESSHGDHSKHR